MSRTLPIIVALLLLVVLGGCITDPGEPMPTEIPRTIFPGDPVPIPTGEVILTISGQIGTTNVGDTLQLDMPILESMGLVEYAVQDPYRLEEVTYTGVLMSDLKKYLQVPESATNFHLVALDDYRVDLSFSDVEQWPILLATQSDGEYMTVENSGPTRIIFPYNSYNIDPVKYNDLWIWNIVTIEVN